MTSTTDIEKKSLEAHVELCAERYKLLETKLEAVELGVRSNTGMLQDLREAMRKVSEKNNDRLIKWGIGIIAALAGVCGWLLTHYLSR